MAGCLDLEAPVEQPGFDGSRFPLAEGFSLGAGGRGEQGDLLQGLVRRAHKMLRTGGQGCGQGRHGVRRIQGVVVLDAHRRLAVPGFDVHRYIEFGPVLGQQFLGHRLAAALDRRVDAQLAGVVDSRRVAVFFHEGQDGAAAVADGVPQGPAGGADEIQGRPAAIDGQGQGQSLDEHAEGILEAQVFPAAADGGEHHPGVAGKAAQGVGGGGQEKLGRGDALGLAESGHLGFIHRGHGFGQPAVF